MLLALAPGATLDADAIEAWLAPIASPPDDVDAWSHTLRALARLAAHPAYATHPAEARAILASAVALHGVGEQVARAGLWRLDTSFAAREHTCALIRFCAAPLALNERLARRISLVTRHDWLALVADAATCGERSDDCALWAEQCRELGILDRTQPFASPHTRRVWCESVTRTHEVPAHDDTTCEVIVMSGLPASGKDTWLATNAPDLPVVSLDALRDELDIDATETQGTVIAAARDRAREYLRAAQPFAWNATALTRPQRAGVVDLLRAYRARVRIIYCETTATEQRRRNRNRAATVPAAAIERMIERWTVPDPTEAHDVTYAVTSDDSWPP
jgi:predicted kinase